MCKNRVQGCVWCFRPVDVWYTGETRKYINSQQIFGAWSPYLCCLTCGEGWNELYESLRYVHQDE